MGDYPIRLEIDFEEKASRLEALIIRWLLAIIHITIVELWGILAILAFAVQWILILLTGKRNKELHNLIEEWYRYSVRVYTYLLLLTDARPPFSGK